MSAATITLRWKSAGSLASSYEVWRSSTSDSDDAVKIGEVTERGYTDTDVVRGVTYYYWTKAVNFKGTSDFGPGTGPILAGNNTLPAPQNLTATNDLVATITLTWDAVAGATGYEVYRNTEDDSDTATLLTSLSATTYDDVPDAADTPYIYWVKATGSGAVSGALSLAVAGWAGPAIPDSPEGVTASTDEAGTITLGWAAADRATVYDVYASEEDDFSTATLVAHNIADLSFEDAVAFGESRYYWVEAGNRSGYSEPSASALGTSAFPVPTAPLSPAAESTEFGVVHVTATAVAYADTYSLFRGSVGDSALATAIASGLADPEYDDDTLVVGTAYYWWKAVSTYGTSPFSVSVSFEAVALADVPTGVTASTNQVGQITVGWNAMDRAALYEVWRSATDDSSGATKVGETEDTTFEDAADYGTSAYYFVKAVNYSGTTAFSASAHGTSVYPIPAPPEDVDASAGSIGLIHVTASESDYALTYELWRATTDDSATATKIADGLSTPDYDDTGIPAGTTYYYWFKAVNATGTSDFSASDSGSTKDLPAIPDGVSATDGSEYAKVILTWSAATGADSYLVYRATTALGTKTLLASGITGLSYEDDDLTDSAAKYYFVKAHNGAGNSDYSSPESGYPAVPATPSSVAASDGTVPGKVTITWAAAGGADSYAVYRSTTFGGAKTLLAGGLTGLTYDDTSLSTTAPVYYWVTATNSVGTSGYGGGDDGYAGLPATPGAPTTTTDEIEFVHLEWGAVDGAASYAVWRSLTGDFADAEQIASGVAALTYDDITAPFDTSLYYFIVAESALGDGLNSPPTLGYSPGTAPDAPTIWFSAQSGVTGINLRWFATAHAIVYEVGMGVTADPADMAFSQDNLVPPIVSGSYSYTWDPAGGGALGLSPQYFYVRAKNRFGPSDWSAAVGPFLIP